MVGKPCSCPTRRKRVRFHVAIIARNLIGLHPIGPSEPMRAPAQSGSMTPGTRYGAVCLRWQCGAARNREHDSSDETRPTPRRCLDDLPDWRPSAANHAHRALLELSTDERAEVLCTEISRPVHLRYRVTRMFHQGQRTTATASSRGMSRAGMERPTQ